MIRLIEMDLRALVWAFKNIDETWRLAILGQFLQ